jgi:hypothetical protein
VGAPGSGPVGLPLNPSPVQVLSSFKTKHRKRGFKKCMSPTKLLLAPASLKRIFQLINELQFVRKDKKDVT